MKRGEIWTLAGGGDYAGKPRPVVIVQNDRFDATQSITICPFTTNPVSAPLFRLPIEPTEENGLHRACQMMADKVMTVPRRKLGTRVGRLSDEEMVAINRALMVFLGIAGPTVRAR